MKKLLFEDMPQNARSLSFCGRIITFNCKQVSGLKSDCDRSELIYTSLSFEREESRFSKASDGAAVISRKKSARVEVVKCACALDVRKRVATPCVLVSKKREKGGSVQYSLLTLSSSNRLEPCIEFKLPYQMNGTVCIHQGPTVLWSHEGNVFYTSLQAGEVRQIPAQLSHYVVGELHLHKEQLFVLGLQKDSEQCTNNISTREALGYFVDTGRVFDGRMILPSPYICITRCILVLSADKVDGVLKSAVVAATSNQQIVYFEDGIVKDTCQLPFEQPEEIQIVNTGTSGCLFVISFHHGHVCAVWKETFQIASNWSGVSSVHVDDFLGCGTYQMLLIFKNQDVTEPLLDNFFLTDLCGISYSHCQDSGAPKKSPPPPENYLLTLQALESRLQSGLTVLQELQREVRLKERVVEQSIQALTDVVSERDPVFTQPEQEGLIALWDCDDESKDEALDDKTQEMPAVSSEPQVDKLWHRLAENQMVVGVILTTDSSVPLASVSLSILTEMGQSSTPAVIQTQSQVFWLPAPCSSSSSSSTSSSSPASTFLEPAAKRGRQHIASRPNDLNTCRLAVTAVTRLTPLLNSGCVKCCVMLHYVQRQDAFPLVSNPTPVFMYCGQVVLDLHSHFKAQLLENPELITDEMKEDLMSLQTVLDRWVFHIDSPDHSLSDIDGWIQERVGCKRIEVSPKYLLLNSSKPSAVMLLHWHQITPFQGKLTVHSSQIQMIQFLNSLLTYLPVSCSIHPVKDTRQQGSARMFSLALEKEVASLRECLTTLLCENEEEEEKRKDYLRHNEIYDGSEEGLQRCRENWLLDVEKGRMRLSPVLDVGKYREQMQSMSKVQLNGDLAALLDLQQTLLS